MSTDSDANFAITAAVAKLDRDFFIYNGPIVRGSVLAFMEDIKASVSRPNVTLLLVTNGGDPDAAFKIARYLQHNYKHVAVLVSGSCKSAGTLLALGAHELVFTPYGELGPLDIQMAKVDRFGQSQSGLVITDAINTLEQRAIDVVYTISSQLMEANQGMISFPTATHVAVESMKAIYGPVLARIDPEEIGTRSRAMRIAQDYGNRLIAASNNATAETLRVLAETYSSHSFVIDHIEAATLFRNARAANDVELEIVRGLQHFARKQGSEPIFRALHAPVAANTEESEDAGIRAEEPSSEDGGDSAGAGQTANAPAAAEPRQGRRGAAQ